MLSDAEAAKDIRVYNLSGPIKARYEEEKAQYLMCGKKLDISWMATMVFGELVKYGAEAVFYVYSIILACRGNITIGELALYFGYIALGSGSIDKLAGFAGLQDDGQDYRSLGRRL
ncbi:MAG TPA: hypothetical protein DCZ91_22675 [Lachnospiraceae bacterium]|nr:hypothetical protein [Lachnospiraceae bacterium]